MSLIRSDSVICCSAASYLPSRDNCNAQLYRANAKFWLVSLLEGLSLPAINSLPSASANRPSLRNDAASLFNMTTRRSVSAASSLLAAGLGTGLLGFVSVVGKSTSGNGFAGRWTVAVPTRGGGAIGSGDGSGISLVVEGAPCGELFLGPVALCRLSIGDDGQLLCEKSGVAPDELCDVGGTFGCGQ